ncbi:tetratricopeptide repeat protein [Actinoalloteichus hymeniacidonis]|nr:tetratricopeptide repeat protein [Actinoalloteichus hymeniacidonis]
MVAGALTGQAVQAGLIRGDIHFHSSVGAAPYPPPRQVPHSSGHFTGRVAEIDLLNALRTDHQTRRLVLAMSGLGGVGKSTLARRWLHQIWPHTGDGQFYAELGGFSGGSPASPTKVLAGFLRSMGVGEEQIPADLADRAALFRTLTADKAVAVLLDDAATAAQVRPLLPSSSRSVVVVTSRMRLVGLSLEGCRFVELRPLDESSSVELLTNIVGAQRTDAEPAVTTALARQCAGLPVALSVAGARLAARPRQPIRRLVAELSSSDKRLSRLAVDAMSVDAVFDLSYRNLEPEVAEVYRLVGWHPGREYGAAVIAAVAGLPVDVVEELLAGLAEASMLEEPAEGRFRQHDLLRLHAAAQCDHARGVQWVRAMAEYYLRRAVGADLVVVPLRPRVGPVYATARSAPPAFDSAAAALGWLRLERENLSVVLEQAVQHEWFELAWQLSESLWGLFLHSRRAEESLAAIRLGIDAARRCGHVLGEATLMGQEVFVLLEIGSTDAALQSGTEALTLAHRVGDRQLEASALAHLGEAARKRCHFTDALDYLRRSLDLEEGPGATRGAAFRHRSIARVLLDLDRVDEAIEEFECARRLLTAIPDQVGAARIAMFLGGARLRAGRPTEAESALAEALTVMESGGSPFYQAEAHRGLGEVAEYRGDQAKAEHHYRRALDLYGGARMSPKSEIVQAALERLRVADIDAVGESPGPDTPGSSPTDIL